jgi:hypothetical protein
VFDLSHAPSQRFGENRPTAIDLAQAIITALLGDGGQVINPLDLVEIACQDFGHEILDAPAGFRQENRLSFLQRRLYGAR